MICYPNASNSLVNILLTNSTYTKVICKYDEIIDIIKV